MQNLTDFYALSCMQQSHEKTKPVKRLDEKRSYTPTLKNKTLNREKLRENKRNSW